MKEVSGEGAKLEETPKFVKLNQPPPLSGANSVPIGAPLTRMNLMKKAKDEKE